MPQYFYRISLDGEITVRFVFRAPDNMRAKGYVFDEMKFLINQRYQGKNVRFVELVKIGFMFNTKVKMSSNDLAVIYKVKS